MMKSRPSIPAPKKARGAKEMADSDMIPQIDPTEIEILTKKLEQNKLEERERRLIVALLRTFLYIVAQLQENNLIDHFDHLLDNPPASVAALRSPDRIRHD
jgi:hypothetical protein